MILVWKLRRVMVDGQYPDTFFWGGGIFLEYFGGISLWLSTGGPMILVWKLRRVMVGGQYPDTLFFWGDNFGIFWGYLSVAVHWWSNDTGMETKEGNGRRPC